MIDKKREILQEEIIKKIQKSDYNACIIVPTGVGKARILIECLKRLNPTGRIFYLADSELNRDKTFKDELIKWGAEAWIDKIEFYCYQTAYKLTDEDVEVCLCDEFDMALTKQYVKAVKNNKFEHLIMVSATLTEDKRIMAEKIRPIVFEAGIQEIEDKGLLNKSCYYEVNFLLTPKESIAYSNFNRKFAELLNDGKKNQQELEFLKVRRGQFLANLKSSEIVCKRLIKKLLDDENNRIIIFCGLNKQADAVCEYSYHSKSVKNWLKEFHEGRIRACAVVGKVNRGANIGKVSLEGLRSFITALIFESPSKSSTRFKQRNGRAKRLQANEVSDVYFLVPHFTNSKGKVLPTIIKKWIRQSTESIDYKPIQYKFEK